MQLTSPWGEIGKSSKPPTPNHVLGTCAVIPGTMVVVRDCCRLVTSPSMDAVVSALKNTSRASMLVWKLGVSA